VSLRIHPQLDLLVVVVHFVGLVEVELWLEFVVVEQYFVAAAVHLTMLQISTFGC
jgi:hypothetical protein